MTDHNVCAFILFILQCLTIYDVIKPIRGYDVTIGNQMESNGRGIIPKLP